MKIQIENIVKEVQGEVITHVEAQLTTNPALSKAEVEAVVVAAADRIIDAVEARLGIGPVADKFIDVPLNALITGLVGHLYDLIKSKIDALAAAATANQAAATVAPVAPVAPVVEAAA